MAKTSLIEAIGIALYNLNNAGKNTCISLKKAYEYQHQIENNLTKMNSTYSRSYFYDYEDAIYFTESYDEFNELVYSINPVCDYKNFTRNFIGNINIDVIKSAYKNNALEILGLELKDGNIIKKELNR